MHPALSAAIIGVVTHVSIFKNIEVDTRLGECLGVLASIPVILICLYQWAGASLVDTLTEVGSLVVGFNCGVFASISAYRLFFHPLGGIPGPILARLSRFYAVYLASKNVEYHRELGKLHDEYGDFVRTGPREISIVRKSAVNLVYGHDSQCRKSTWYSQLTLIEKNGSVQTTRDHNLHRKRRRGWDRGLAIKVLPSYEPRIKDLVDVFVERVSEGGKPLNATTWCMLLSYDVMGRVGFGNDFGCLAEGRPHPGVSGIHDTMEAVSTVGQVPWFLYLLSYLPGSLSSFKEFFQLCGDQVNSKIKNWQPDESPNDVMSWLIKAYMEKDDCAPPTMEGLHQDSRTMIVAGSGTNATSLVAILFYLARNPKVLQKARQLLDAVIPTSKDWSYDKVKSVSYLDDIINETMRLKPSVLVGGPRVTPPQGFRVDGQFVPGNCNIIVPMDLLHKDPRYWKDAQEFIPERFGERKEEFATGDAPFYPFEFGPYSCPGKNLSFLVLRVAISRIIQELDFSFAPGEDGTTFDNRWKETFAATAPPLQLVFTRRDNSPSL